ncbi:amidase [Ferrovibrio sp.]|uniref:amidase n=1 Tax=Ferrovibrio sp. TaxID=1917215 RepID=UPI0035AFDC51
MPTASPGFVPGGVFDIAPTASGALDGLRFAVKDLIDVAGRVTGGGNPDWASLRPPVADHAPVVARLLAAGARLVGKTITDELAFSLEGENAHYGTPPNPRCPGRLPGGSSSGSASVVAAGLADFALGTDTGGSVRVPASFCGLYGYRPSHGRIPLDGVLPFAPSYDTVGLLAPDAAILAAAGRLLLGNAGITATPIRRLFWAQDAYALLPPAIAAALPKYGEATSVYEGQEAVLLEAYRVLQGADIKASLGSLISSVRPRFGPAIAPRFADALATSEAQLAEYRPLRLAFAARLRAMLPPGTALLLPSAPGPALALNSPADAIADFYRKALTLCCVAGHAGLPAISLPLTTWQDCPLGLSILAGPGQDEALLDFALHGF